MHPKHVNPKHSPFLIFVNDVVAACQHGITDYTFTSLMSTFIEYFELTHYE